MTQRFAVVSTQPDFVATQGPAEGVEGFDAEDVFDLIDQTASTILWLRQENERLGQSEAACRATIAQDRAQWREDVAKLKDVAKTCLERAATAEAQIEEAKAQRGVALLMCREAQERERDAETRASTAERRADAAEQWLGKISKALTDDVRGLLKVKA